MAIIDSDCLLPDGTPPAPALVVLDGEPTLYVTKDLIYDAPRIGGLAVDQGAVLIPGEAIETGAGVVLLDRSGPSPADTRFAADSPGKAEGDLSL
jgi:hypothetical protein